MKKFTWKSPIGFLAIELSAQGLRFLQRVDKALPPHTLSEAEQDVVDQLQAYFDGRLRDFNIKLDLSSGSDFQQRVWGQLCQIPYGETCCYSDIAKKLGAPRAMRAVGMANSKNPIWIVVPCHRVIARSGALSGYAGGIEMKQALLELEQKK